MENHCGGTITLPLQARMTPTGCGSRLSSPPGGVQGRASAGELYEYNVDKFDRKADRLQITTIPAFSYRLLGMNPLSSSSRPIVA